MHRRVSTIVFAVVLSGALLASSAARATSPPSQSQRVPGGIAIPLSTAGPSWYGLSYYQRVIASGVKGARVPFAASVPGTIGLATPGIHPGLWLVTLLTDPNTGIGFAWCTANFVFKRYSTLAIGTAGHCAAKDALGQFPDVTAYVVPPPGQGAPGFFHIGKFVLSHNRGVGDDFALVQLYSRYRSWVVPTMPVWGGPSGVYRSNAASVVEWFGNAAGFGTGGTPRAGYAPVWTAEHGTGFAWVGPSFEGDSGSGVITLGGAAAGDLTHLIVGVGGGGIYGQPYPAMMAGTRMTKILQIAKGWSLVGGAPLPV